MTSNSQRFKYSLDCKKKIILSQDWSLVNSVVDYESEEAQSTNIQGCE